VAGLKDFQRLPGIGPHLAKMIVEHRDKNGSFVAPDEIREVKGIGPKKYNKIKDYLTVE
jgi:competence protein ComEA